MIGPVLTKPLVDISEGKTGSMGKDLWTIQSFQYMPLEAKLSFGQLH